MKKLFVIIAVLFYSAAHAQSAEVSAAKPTLNEINIEAIINQKYPSCKILSPTDLNEGLQSYLIKSLGHQTPGIVPTDLTGDGIKDYAVLLRCKNKKAPNRVTEKFAILVGKGNNKYDWNFIAKWEDKLSLDNLYLTLIEPSTLKDVNDGKEVQLTNAGVELNLFEAAARVYYFENGKIKFVQVSD